MYKINSEVIINSFEEGHIVQLNDQFFCLDNTTYEIMDELLKKQSINEVINNMLQEYDVAHDILQNDVNNTIENLTLIGVIKNENET